MKSAIITGASKGIGKAIALKLAALSYSLVLVGRNKEHLANIKSEIEKMGGRCKILSLDLEKTMDDIRKIAESIRPC